MAYIGDLAADILGLDAEIERLEKHLNTLKAKRHMMATSDLPEAMTEYGSSVWKNNRVEVKVDHKIYGNLPQEEDRRNEAIDYLHELGESGIISADLKASFGKGDTRYANKMKRLLRFHLDAADRDEPVIVQANVHVMTLQALARRRVKENKPIRLDTLGLRTLTIASVKPIKG